MHVERHVRQRPQRRDHIRSKADIRHKIAVHNVEMQPVRILHRPQAITHPRVVAREHRGSYFHFYHLFLPALSAACPADCAAPQRIY